jgi:hypothetical protein
MLLTVFGSGEMTAPVIAVGLALLAGFNIAQLWAFDDALRRLEKRIGQAEADVTTLTNQFKSLRQFYVASLWKLAQQEVKDALSQEGGLRHE